MMLCQFFLKTKKPFRVKLLRDQVNARKNTFSFKKKLMSLSICNYHLLTIHTKTFGHKPICLYSSLSLLGNKKWGTNWIKAKTSKLIKKKNIQNVTMTYRKIEYSFDIRMKIRMLEVYLNLFFECISTYQIPKKNQTNKQPNNTIYFIRFNKKIFV